jgi:hypothetical protein
MSNSSKRTRTPYQAQFEIHVNLLFAIVSTPIGDNLYGV